LAEWLSGSSAVGLVVILLLVGLSFLQERPLLEIPVGLAGSGVQAQGWSVVVEATGVLLGWLAALLVVSWLTLRSRYLRATREVPNAGSAS
jgi:hypothetical protein